MSIEINLNPIGREEIHRLEAALLIGTLLRPEVLELFRESTERLTWVDSLAVAAGAIARERAKMPISKIAEELGRTEATIRNHLTGKTKAGHLVRETLRKFIKEGVKLEVPIIGVSMKEVNELKEKIEKLENELTKERKEKEELKKKLEKIKETLSSLMAEL